MAEISWHLDATVDLDALAEFIARDSPLSASLFVNRIIAIVGRLADHPESGRVVPEIGDVSYRELIFQNYRIVYRLLSEQVVILGVVHGAMDMERQIESREWDVT